MYFSTEILPPNWDEFHQTNIFILSYVQFNLEFSKKLNFILNEHQTVISKRNVAK